MHQVLNGIRQTFLCRPLLSTALNFHWCPLTCLNFSYHHFQERCTHEHCFWYDWRIRVTVFRVPQIYVTFVTATSACLLQEEHSCKKSAQTCPKFVFSDLRWRENRIHQRCFKLWKLNFLNRQKRFGVYQKACFKGKRRKVQKHQRAFKVVVGDPFAQHWCIDFGFLFETILGHLSGHLPVTTLRRAP